MAAPRVTPAGNNILVTTGAYNPDWRVKANALRGRWDGRGKFWTFPAEKEPSVRAALRSVFGTDGSDAVYVIYECHGDADHQAAYCLDRRILWRTGEGTKPVCGDGCEIISGGYVRNWPEPDRIGPNDLMVGWWEERSKAEAARLADPYHVRIFPKRPTAGRGTYRWSDWPNHRPIYPSPAKTAA